MSEINFNTLNDILLARFPELSNFADYKWLVDLYDGEGIGEYVLYESAFQFFILEKIECGDETSLRDIFNFIEELATNGDAQVRDLLDIGLIEGLLNRLDLAYAKIIPYVGPNTLQILKEVSARLQLPEPEKVNKEI